MDIGVVLQTNPPAWRTVELAKRAENLGFTHVWTFDSHLLWEEPFVIYSQILSETRKVMVGPMVTNPATRDWTVTASLFATLNAEGRVARLDLRTGAVTKASTGSAPRSLAIAADGRALSVVNDGSGTVSKLRASDLHVMQTIPACPNPIGITDEPVTRRVRVACYGGQVRVYDDGARP